MKDADRRLVVVTGGASGIGAAAANCLAEAGFRPLVVDLTPTSPAQQIDDVLYWPKPLDVSQETEVESSVSTIEREHGSIYGLVNAAGILGKIHAPEAVRLHHWDREMAIDLRGTFVMCQAVGRHMLARGSGSIVNIASIAGVTACPAIAYGAAKAGVVSLTQNLACAWGPGGIRVNAVSPGFTRTPALQKGLDSGALPESGLARASALKRLVEAREVGEAIAFLISHRSSGITGINLPVDAGFLSAVAWGAYAPNTEDLPT